jgi:DNA repair exonuclease SbcCD nuclease subunit
MRIGLIADVHLDSAFALFPPLRARARRHAIEEAFGAALTSAAEASVDVIFLAGDLYEHDRVLPNTGEFLRSVLREIAPLPVFIAPGNHDWYGPESLYARLEWSPNVHVFGQDGLEPIELADGLTLWGAGHCAPANTAGFLDGFRTDRGGVNIALFHGSEQSALLFQEETKVPHAPFRAEQVDQAGLAHVFSGHFHTPVDDPRYTYPGNPEPLSFGEPGEPTRGLVIAMLHADGTVERERVRVAQTAVTDVEFDVSGCSSANEIREQVRAELDGLTGDVRLTLRGELQPEVDLELDDLSRLGPSSGGVVVRTGAISVGYDLDAIKDEATVRGAFVNDVLESTQCPEELKRRVIVTGLRALEGRPDLEVV